jgi:outer membrane protein assembly factor BamB
MLWSWFCRLFFLVLTVSSVTPALAGVPGTPGTQKWAYLAGSIGYSNVVLDAQGVVYVADNSGCFNAINKDGTEKWKFSTAGNVILSSPTVAPDGTIYMGLGTFFAFNPDGTQKWAKEFMGCTLGCPAIAPDGTIYVTNSYGTASYPVGLVAFGPDGHKKWVFPMTPSDSSPAIAVNGTIYVGSSDMRLYAVNPDGSKKWDYYMGAEVRSSPAIGGDGTIYAGSKNGRIWAINPDGSKKWVYVGGYDVLSSPAVAADGTIYVGGGRVYALDPTNGNLKWSFNPGPAVLSSPAIGADGIIYIGAKSYTPGEGDSLYALNPDCTVKWRFPTLGEVTSSPAIGPDGTVYVGCADGYVYAVYSTSLGLADSPWPMFHHDVRHTGRAGYIPSQPKITMAPVISLLLSD